MTTVLVGGFGSMYRRDDGVGPLVAEQVAADNSDVGLLGPFLDPLDVLGLWDHVNLVVLIDATRSGCAIGTVRTIELDPDAPEWPSAPSEDLSDTTSTHGIGLANVLRLARAVGGAPSRVVVVGIEGENFDFGEGLSPAVAARVPDAVQLVLGLIAKERLCA